MKLDCLIQNGTQINFDTMTTYTADLCIKDGKIVDCPPGEDREARITIDATGKYVVPGLFDFHLHVNCSGGFMGINPDVCLIPYGVTGALDAGSCGCFNFEQFYRLDIMPRVPNIYALLNICSHGVEGVTTVNMRPELLNPAEFREDDIRKVFDKHPDILRGLKIRFDRDCLANTYGIEALERTVEIAEKIEKVDGHRCLVGLHFDWLPEYVHVPEICKTLRPGDIFYHLYMPRGETIYDENGHVRECMKEARRRGVLFDNANARFYWNWKNLTNAFADGFFPDMVGTDLVNFNLNNAPLHSLPYTMAVMSAAGMGTLELFRATTLAPASAIGVLDKNGTLEVGKPANVSVFDVSDWTDKILIDGFGTPIKANKRFTPLCTVKDGQVLYRAVDF